MPVPLRVGLSPDLVERREQLAALVPLLEAGIPGAYGSVFFERKSSRSLWANLKQTQMTEQVSAGAVLRLFDGHTLYEQATDQLAPAELLATAERLVARVQASPRSSGPARPYVPATWKARLAEPLDPEITSQIPPQVRADSPVHFGIRYRQDPRAESPAATFTRLRALVDRCRESATRHGLAESDLSYALARQTFAIEESIFVDRESNLSQSLFRTALTLMTMSGSDRTFRRMGGLGGLEITDADRKAHV